MTPLQEIRAALGRMETVPSRSLGQNFLFDANLARWIAGQLDFGPGDRVLEIGPGLGALTGPLLERGARLLAIDKDARMVGYLRERFAGTTAEFEEADAARYDARPLFADGPLAVIGNLPYYVTSPVLERFAGESSPANQVLIMVQREVAARLGASPSTPEYGALTVVMGRRWHTRMLRTVPPDVFYPAPSVESAVVRMDRRPVTSLPPCDAGWFERLVRAGFAQRRKQLHKLLRPFAPDIADVLRDLGHEPGIRAEALSLEEWTEVARRTAAEIPGEGQKLDGEWFDVVDARNRVTGRETRRTVHVNKLRHRAVHLFVFNSLGELFLQKRSPWKDHFPGRWDSSASGHVDSGDDYPAAAERELREELGITASVREIGRIDACEETGQEFLRLYTAEHEGPFRLAPAEIESGLFFPIAVVHRWIRNRPEDFAPGFLACLRVWQAVPSTH